MKLARILFSHTNARKAEEAMLEMINKLNPFKNVEIVGSGKAPVEKISNKWRYTILLRASKSTDLLKAIYAAKNDLAQVDMDPVEFT